MHDPDMDTDEVDSLDAAVHASTEERIARAAKAFTDFMDALGVPWTDSTEATPLRVAKMYVRELCTGLEYDPTSDLSKTFGEGHDEIVIQRDITFTSLCEHHFLPFFGVAHVGYIPSEAGGVVGLSKMARVVRGFARQPSMQERLSQQVADALEGHLKARGVMVVIEASHQCMSIRGVQAHEARTITSVVRGVFKDKPPARDEFLRLISRPR